MFTGIVREEGLSKLYRGLTPACLRHCIYSGTRVGAYEFLRENVFKRDENGRFALWKGVLCGMSAGAIGQFVANPTDVVKVQMQLEGKRLLQGLSPRYNGTIDAFVKLSQQVLFENEWRGFSFRKRERVSLIERL